MLSRELNDYFGLREAPFNPAPNPRFFYSNPRFEGALSDVRHGIDEKKGIIVISAEAGTGKTTLLRKLISGWGGSASSVFIFCPYLNFSELLRIILHDLGLTSHEEDRNAMLAELTGHLNLQFEHGRTTCLLIDEAQNLSAELFEGISVLSDLENDGQKLLPIVLAGQPGLEAKLNEQKLQELKRRVAIQCQLAPLKGNDVGLYIDHRLRKAGYEGNGLFDGDAIERIAAYSQGIPRVINLICDRALFTAHAAAKEVITADVIQEVARDLDLADKTEIANECPPDQFNVPWEREDLTRVALPDPDISQWEFNSEVDELKEEKLAAVGDQRNAGKHALGSFLSRAAKVGVGTLSVLLVLMAGRGAIYSDQSKNYLSDLAVVLDTLIETGKERLGQSDRVGEPGPMAQARTKALGSGLPARVDGALARESDKAETLDGTTAPRKMKRAEASGTASIVEKPTQSGNSSNVSEKVSPSYAGRRFSPGERDAIEMKLYNAISNRAISGVVVSFIDGTVYLDGRVATERQKMAAVQAARSVSGVKYVRDRVRVSY